MDTLVSGDIQESCTGVRLRTGYRELEADKADLVLKRVQGARAPEKKSEPRIHMIKMIAKIRLC